MPSKKRKQKMVDSDSVATNDEPAHTPPLEAPVYTPAHDEEKVDVMIKEVVRIRPQDFSAFKHALEEFVNGWS
jgi:hypothetical protein